MKERIIGLDILRILAMLGIVGVHVIGIWGGLEFLPISSFKYFCLLFILIIFKTSVNTFGLLTGYLYAYTYKPKNRNIINIILTVIFYCLVIPIIFYGFNIFNVQSIGIVKLIKSILAPLFGHYWYIVGYILLFFLIPYLNVLIKKLDKQTLQKLLLTLFILLSIIPTLLGQIDLFRIFNGFSGWWLIYIYMLGAYIRIYEDNNQNKKQIIFKLLLLLIITFLLNLIVRISTYKIFGQIKLDDWFTSYVSPLMILISAYLLILFKKIKKLKSKCLTKIILKISMSTFSVYIIHAQPIIYENILPKIIHSLLNNNSYLLVISILVIIFFIYFICFLIDQIKKLIFKLLKIDFFQNYIGDKLDKKIYMNIK